MNKITLKSGKVVKAQMGLNWNYENSIINRVPDFVNKAQNDFNYNEYENPTVNTFKEPSSFIGTKTESKRIPNYINPNIMLGLNAISEGTGLLNRFKDEKEWARLHQASKAEGFTPNPRFYSGMEHVQNINPIMQSGGTVTLSSGKVIKLQGGGEISDDKRWGIYTGALQDLEKAEKQYGKESNVYKNQLELVKNYRNSLPAKEESVALKPTIENNTPITEKDPNTKEYKGDVEVVESKNKPVKKFDTVKKSNSEYSTIDYKLPPVYKTEEDLVLNNLIPTNRIDNKESLDLKLNNKINYKTDKLKLEKSNLEVKNTQNLVKELQEIDILKQTNQLDENEVNLKINDSLLKYNFENNLLNLKVKSKDKPNKEVAKENNKFIDEKSLALSKYPKKVIDAIKSGSVDLRKLYGLAPLKKEGIKKAKELDSLIALTFVS
jgi:hypothetical protein